MNGASPSGVLNYSKPLKDDVRKRLRAEFDEFKASGSKRRDVLMLQDGMTFSPISIAPEAAEVLASRSFSVTEIARLYQVPLILISDPEAMRGTAAASAAMAWFGALCLAPWCRKIETEVARSLLADPALCFDLDLSGLMRGDFATRVTAEVALVGAGIATPNEIRGDLGYPPHKDGDVLRQMPGAPDQNAPKSPADAAADQLDGKLLPNIGKPNGHANGAA
jgi:HK97 family phage portal protein